MAKKSHDENNFRVWYYQNFEASANYDRLLRKYTVFIGALFLVIRYKTKLWQYNFPGTMVDAFAHKNIGIAGRATYSYYDRLKTFFNLKSGYNTFWEFIIL